VTGQQSSSVRFECPSCGGRVKVPPGQAGQKCRCPKCNAEILAPSPAGQETRETHQAFEDDFFSESATGGPAPVPTQSPPNTDVAIPSPPPAQGVLGVQQASEDDLLSGRATELPVRAPTKSPPNPEVAIPSPPPAQGVLGVQQASEDDFFLDSESALLASAPARTPPQPGPQHRDVAPPPEERAASPPKVEAGQGQAASKRAKSPAAPNTRQEFGIECMVCGTRMYATLDQVGKQLKCPDCHSKVLVKAPKKPVESAPVYESDDGDFKLSPPVEVPRPAHLPQEDVLPDRDDDSADTGHADGPAKQKMPRERLTGNAIRDNARDTMAKAQAEVDEEEQAKPKMPDQPFKTGMISFLFDAAAILRLVLLTLAGHTAVASLVGAFSMASGGPVQQFAAIFLFVVVGVLGLISLFTASACCVVIIQETANGYDKMEQWPGLNIGDWMMDALYVFNSLFASVAVGVLPCLLVATTEATMLVGAVTGTALFPVFVLSAMEEGSPLGFASRPMWQSLRTASQIWLKFYLLSVALAFGGILAVYLLTVSLAGAGGFLYGAFFSAILVAIGMIYCRLLGRLAWLLSEQAAQDDGGANAKSKPERNAGGAQPRRDAGDAVPSERLRPASAEKPVPSVPPPSGAGKSGIPMVQCPHCRVTFKAHDAGLLGKEVPCPMCRKPFIAQPLAQPSG